MDIERRLAFLLDLGDRLRGLTEPSAIKTAAAEALGRQLRAARVGYGEIDATGTEISVEGDWTDGSVSSLAGKTKALENFGPEVVSEWRAGRPVQIDDITADRRSAPYASGYTSIQTRSLIAVPLLKAGRWHAKLYVHEPRPRRWTEAEKVLVLDVAERTRDAVERARAESALRESEARLRHVLAAANAGWWEWDVKTGASVWSDENFALHGVSPAVEPMRHAVWENAVHQEDRARVKERVSELLAGRGREYKLEYRIQHPQRGERWIVALGQIERDSRGEALHVSGINLDITDRKRTEQALREALERRTEILESISDAFFALNADWRFTYANHRALEIWGKNLEDVAGRRMFEVFPEAAGSEMLEAYRQAMESRKTVHFETISPIVRRWLSITVYPSRGGGLSVYFRDITERKEAEQRLKLLAAEVDHRSKNLLALVQIVLRQTRAQDAGEYAKAVQGRVATLARTHTLLSESRWQGADLRRLVEEELAPFRLDGQRVSVAGPSVALRPKAAQSFAMTVHELASNAVKHGALSTQEGAVRITWSRSSDGSLSLSWVESGVRRLEPSTRRGLGRIVIEQTIREQLGGHIEFDLRPQGLRCVLRVPAEALDGDASAADAGAPTDKPG